MPDLIKRISFAILLIFVCSCLHAQDVQELEKQLQYQSTELEKIRREIQDFNKRISASKKEEKSMLQQLNHLDEEINLISRLIRQLGKEESKKEKEIKNLELNIDTRQKAVEKLKADFAERLVRIYKQGTFSEWELLLSSRSLNEIAYRYKYLRVLADFNEKTMNELRSQIDHIHNQKVKLNQELADLKKIIQEKDSEQRSLQRKKNQRKQMLAQVRKDRKSLEESLAERKMAAEELEKLIASLEKEKKERQEELARLRAREGISSENRFLKAQGQLPWPVKGQIVSRFGTTEHPVLKTVTENTGIDIKAPKGSNVHVVMDGVVSAITWIRGFGNTIIVDHGDGFYTVYTHVDAVFVDANQYVSSGEVIANVGDSGSLDGAKLHFEIWGGRQKLNPEHWLSRLRM